MSGDKAAAEVDAIISPAVAAWGARGQGARSDVVPLIRAAGPQGQEHRALTGEHDRRPLRKV